MQGPIQLKPTEVAWEHLACLGEGILSRIASLLLEAVGQRQHALSLRHRAVCAAEDLVRPLAMRSCQPAIALHAGSVGATTAAS